MCRSQHGAPVGTAHARRRLVTVLANLHLGAGVLHRCRPGVAMRLQQLGNCVHDEECGRS